MNVKEELLNHIKVEADGREVEYIHIWVGEYEQNKKATISGKLEDVIPMLDFNYDDGYGAQELHGHIWYADGTWSERGEYDGAEWWEHKKRPEIPCATE